MIVKNSTGKLPLPRSYVRGSPRGMGYAASVVTPSNRIGWLCYLTHHIVANARRLSKMTELKRHGLDYIVDVNNPTWLNYGVSVSGD